MKNSCISLGVVLGLLACSSTDSGSEQGIQVVGSVTGTTNVSRLSMSPRRADFYNGTCLDNTNGGVSATLSPTSYKVALKKLTLLGSAATGTPNYELFSATDVSEAYVADFATDTTFFSSESYPTSGTYDGIEIEVFYIEMTIPMIIPAISETETSYQTRGYFTQVGNIEKRDVTVFSSDLEYWINRQTDLPEPYELVAVTEDHPFQVLDLWADDNFWNRDPVTISTADTTLGTDFRFEMADGSTGLTIPDAASGQYVITLAFDVTNKFTFWEYLVNGQAADADGKFRVGFDCGYRILFPDVQISIESPS